MSPFEAFDVKERKVEGRVPKNTLLMTCLKEYDSILLAAQI